jgi:prolipoprotein diacylglyceryltransferase
MFPSFMVFGVTVYTFGLALSVALGLFVWMLYRLSIKFGINTNFFLGNILFFFLSSFLFSRLFYIIAEWRDYKFIFQEGIFRFFFMSDYNFSIIGALFGFILILYINIRKFKLSSNKYMDAVFLSFFFAATVGFFGGFLGGQICGAPTTLPIGMSYVNFPGSACPFTSPIFPLALFYSVTSFILFCTLYIARQFVQVEGFVGYMGVLLFASILFIGEFFNGSTDIVKSFIPLNLNQIGSLGLLAIGIR